MNSNPNSVKRLHSDILHLNYAEQNSIFGKYADALHRRQGELKNQNQVRKVRSHLNTGALLPESIYMKHEGKRDMMQGQLKINLQRTLKTRCHDLASLQQGISELVEKKDQKSLFNEKHNRTNMSSQAVKKVPALDNIKNRSNNPYPHGISPTVSEHNARGAFGSIDSNSDIRHTLQM